MPVNEYQFAVVQNRLRSSGRFYPHIYYTAQLSPLLPRKISLMSSANRYGPVVILVSNLARQLTQALFLDDV